MEIFHPDFGFPVKKTSMMKNLSQFASVAACKDRSVVTDEALEFALGKEPLM